MSDRRPRSVHLADVAALAVAIGQDEQLSLADQAARDRRLAAQIPTGGEDRTDGGLRWLKAVQREDAALSKLHHHVRQSLAWAQAGLLGVGLFSGWLAALGALYYDGSSRINVITLIGVLVLLPGLFLFAFVLAAVPPGTSSRIPGAGALAALARALSPARLAMAGRRFLPAELRQSWETIGGHLGRHQTLYGGIQRWALLRGSQLFALGFQLAALTASLALIVFSDLAFGWSTTLTSGDPAQDAAQVHHFASVAATPWSAVVPAALPSAELVAESRYYRATRAEIDAPMAARLGGWWPFVIMVLLAYGLLPRVLTLLFAHVRLRAATAYTFVATPGLTSILHRLHRHHLATTSAEPEATERARARPSEPAPPPPLAPLAPRAVINWAGIPLPDEALRAAFGEAPVFAAGGECSLAHDTTLTEQLAADQSTEDRTVVLAVKAWEPPLLELTDFLRALRASLGPGAPIAVVPLSLDEAAKHPQAPSAPALQVWQNKLRPLGDPWLQVLPFSPQVFS